MPRPKRTSRTSRIEDTRVDDLDEQDHSIGIIVAYAQLLPLLCDVNLLQKRWESGVNSNSLIPLVRIGLGNNFWSVSGICFGYAFLPVVLSICSLSELETLISVFAIFWSWKLSCSYGFYNTLVEFVTFWD